MSHLRFVLAWLIMLALPLQGFAAATMVFCAGEHHGTSAVIQEAHENSSRGHSAHRHAAVGSHHENADDARSGQALPDAKHKCGVCASCCYSVAVTQDRTSSGFVPVERTHLTESFLRIDTAPAEVPDKPPRT